MRVLMTGGGTGGHVNPAIAIADTIREKEPDSEIAFVGTSHGIENKLVPQAGYPLYHIEIRGLRRSLSLENLKTAFLTVKAVREGERLIRDFQPDIVIGTGGYACYPILRAATLKHVPTILHEANAMPGVAVRMLEPFVTRVFLNFDESREHLHHPEKAVRIGNPLRMRQDAVTREEARALLEIENYRSFVLSCGGSMGAEPINWAVLDMMKRYGTERPDILFVHASGKLEYEPTRERFLSDGLDRFPNLVLLEYIDDMPIRMAAADCVVSRSGSMTLSELALLGRASVLIPSPHVTDNHQFKNAKVLSDRGAALLLEESALTGDSLWEAVSGLLDDPDRRHGMENAVKELAVTDAGEKIYEECLRLIGRK